MDCLFCNFDKKEYVLENELAFVIYDKFPVNKGHALVIPKRHFESYFDITNEELLKINELIKKMKDILIETYKPDGFNIGINIGKYAGQSIFHLHVHIIPRYKNDVKKQRLKGGIRNFKEAIVKY
ncbi:HIT family protein [Peptostreptococcaceae bacterium AGR-M142]